VVVRYDELPRITDRHEAEAAPELSMLSAIAHPDLAVALAALDAIETLPEDSAARYFDVIMTALPGPVRDALEAAMERHEYQSDFAKRHFARGREEGLRDVLVELARAKLGALGVAEEARLRAVRADAMITLVVALGRARDTAEARGILDATRAE
jgi:hypothetical protein